MTEHEDAPPAEAETLRPVSGLQQMIIFTAEIDVSPPAEPEPEEES